MVQRRAAPQGEGVGEGSEREGEGEGEGAAGPHLRAEGVARPIAHRFVPLRIINGPRILLTRSSHRRLQLRSPLRAA